MKKRNVQIPKWAPMAGVAAVAVLALLVGWELVLAPKQHAIASLHDQTALVEEQVATDLTRAATAREGTGAPTIKVADIYKLQTAMPSATEMPDLLLELDQTAKAAGVELQGISPSASAAATGPYATVQLSLTATGNFYSLTDLLYRLRNLVYVRDGALEANGRIFAVNSVTLTPSSNLVNATISLDTYVYNPAPPAPPPTTITPGSTTTTPSPSAGPAAAGATP